MVVLKERLKEGFQSESAKGADMVDVAIIGVGILSYSAVSLIAKVWIGINDRGRKFFRHAS